MLSLQNIFDTIDMIDKQHLDIRTITMGISLLDCCRRGPEALPATRSTTRSPAAPRSWCKTGEDIEREFGIPIVNKRISVTPIALVAGAPARREDYVPFALALDRGRQDLRRQLHRRLLRPGAEGLDRRRTEKLIALHSRGAGRHRAGLLQRQRGLHQGGHQHGRRGADGPRSSRRPPQLHRATRTASAAPSWWCSATPWRTTPSWPAPSTAWARPDSVINVGVSGPGVVYHALQSVQGPALRRGGRDHQEDRLPDHPHGPAGGPGGQPAGWACPSASWTCPWPPPRPWATAWPASWRRWAWRSAAPTAPRPRWPC